MMATETTTATTTTTKTPAVTSTEADSTQCGHDQDCSNSEGSSTVFTTACLSGGLGCNAMGRPCCRYCGFGAFAGIACSSNGAVSTVMAVSTAQPTASLRG